MAPIELDLHSATLQAVAGIGGYAAASTALTTLICYDILYKSYKALPPSQDTRHRQPSREKHVQIHALLVVAALATACYHAYKYISLSYRVWANEKEMPALRTAGWDLSSHHHIGAWWLDTSLLEDALEILVDRSRRFWYAQQYLLGLAGWAIALGLEARRRSIRHIWAFILLAQFVSLSLALNLFLLAVLLSPISVPSTVHDPSARSVEYFQVRLAYLPDVANDALTYLRTHLPPFPTHPHAYPWTPSPYAYMPTMLVLQGAIYLLPYTTHTGHFLTAMAIINIACYRLAYMDRLTPVAHGSTAHPSRKYTFVYRIASLISLMLYIKSTAVALLDNDPGAYPSDHRHSRYLAALLLPHERERSGLTRSRLSFTRVLSSVNDHPIVAMVGYDVLLAVFSLCTWAVIRGLNVETILYLAGITHVKPLSAADEADVNAIKRGISSASSVSKPRRRKRKSTTNATTSSPAILELEQTTPAAAAGKETVDDDVAAKGDRTFQSSAAMSKLSRGEEEEAENLEAGAVAGALAVIGGLGALINGVLGAESES